MRPDSPPTISSLPCVLFVSRCCPAADLPNGARVGTSSLRRKAQLLHAHPNLNVVPVRGNIDARVKMLQDGQLDAIVLAAAGEWASCVRQSHGHCLCAPNRVWHGASQLSLALVRGRLAAFCSRVS